MAGIVCVYASALGILGLLVRSLAPSHPSVVFIVALAGCVLCTVWGVAAIAGYRSRAAVILTLIPVALVLLYQALHAWWPAPTQSPPPVSVAALLTGTFALSVGLLLYLFHGERPPDTRPAPTPRRDPAPASSAGLAERTGSPSDTRHAEGKGIRS